jgi:hypothetical protein
MIKFVFQLINWFKTWVKTLVLDPNGLGIGYHDLCHLECSQLKPIRIGQVKGIDGVSGIYLPPNYSQSPLGQVFMTSLKEVRYCGQYDETRVALHQYVICRGTCFEHAAFWRMFVRLCYHMVVDKDNPIRIYKEHLASYK